MGLTITVTYTVEVSPDDAESIWADDMSPWEAADFLGIAPPRAVRSASVEFGVD